MIKITKQWRELPATIRKYGNTIILKIDNDFVKYHKFHEKIGEQLPIKIFCNSSEYEVPNYEKVGDFQ